MPDDDEEIYACHRPGCPGHVGPPPYPTCIADRTETEVTRLRRQVADLAEERDVLVRQLVAIRAMITAPGGFYVAELQRILDGAAR